MALTLRLTKGSPLTYAEGDANFSGLADLSLTTFLQSGTGAVARTVQSKARDEINLADFLPFNYSIDGSVNYAAQIQAALTYAGTQIDVSIGGGAKVMSPRGVLGIGSQIQIPPQVQLAGHGRASEIRAISGTFPVSTALVRLGTGAALAFNCRTENISINCNNISGSIGLYSTDIQEQSGAFGTLIRAYGKNGIVLDGLAGQGCSNYTFDTIECNTNVGGAGNDGIWIKSAQSWKSTWRNISIVAPVGTPGDNAIRIATGVNTPIIQGLHAEYFTHAINAEAGCQNVLIVGADSNGCTNLLTTSTVGRVTALGLFRVGGTNIVNDTVAGITNTSAALPQYIRGELVDIAGMTNRGVLAQQGQSQIVGTVAAPILVDKSIAAIGTGRMAMFVGDGTGGTTADQNYIKSLNTFLHFMTGASGTTEALQITDTGALRGLITTNGPVGILTLAANAGTTVVSNTAVTANSIICLFQTSANAAADAGSAAGVWVSSKSAGASFTITHPNNANADKTFNYIILN